MLSFEISAIDVVLLIAMLVLLLLLITQKKSRSLAEPRLNMGSQKKLLNEPNETGETTMETSLKGQSAAGFEKCVHQFGYLRNMPTNTSVPDECFGCPKVLRCMFPNE